jgi:hypothetical protein
MGGVVVIEAFEEYGEPEKGWLDLDEALAIAKDDPEGIVPVHLLIPVIGRCTSRSPARWPPGAPRMALPDARRPEGAPRSRDAPRPTVVGN